VKYLAIISKLYQEKAGTLRTAVHLKRIRREKILLAYVSLKIYLISHIEMYNQDSSFQRSFSSWHPRFMLPLKHANINVNARDQQLTTIGAIENDACHRQSQTSAIRMLFGDCYSVVARGARYRRPLVALIGAEDNFISRSRHAQHRGR